MFTLASLTSVKLEKPDVKLVKQINFNVSLSARRDTPLIAFTVKDTSGEWYERDERIQFRTVMTNIGDGYNSQTHEFIVPQSGINMPFENSIIIKNQQTIYVQRSS